MLFADEQFQKNLIEKHSTKDGVRDLFSIYMPDGSFFSFSPNMSTQESSMVFLGLFERLLYLTNADSYCFMTNAIVISEKDLSSSSSEECGIMITCRSRLDRSDVSFIWPLEIFENDTSSLSHRIEVNSNNDVGNTDNFFNSSYFDDLPFIAKQAVDHLVSGMLNIIEMSKMDFQSNSPEFGEEEKRVLH